MSITPQPQELCETSSSPKKKKCSGCSRIEQPISAFMRDDGFLFSTCLKCREKGKKIDNLPGRKQSHNLRQLVMNAEYCQNYREKLKQQPTTK